MELRRVRRGESPRDTRYLRLTGEVVFDTGRVPATELWFEVPWEQAEGLAERANAWLACLLALAAHRGEALRLCHPVDTQLLRGARELLHIWHCWYPSMQVIDIDAETCPTLATAPVARTASMFSGGVDSFFTALGEDGTDDLIIIPGFGMLLDDHDAVGARGSVAAAAAALGKTLIVVPTNVTASSSVGYPWELSHSGVLAAAGLLLEHRCARVLIPSTHGYGDLRPGGSHPLTDPLFSTAQTQVIHHGSAFTRAAKLESIAAEEVVQQTLHVCGFRSDRNCGTCRKCYCTMLHLDVLGLLPQYRTTFPVADYDPAAVARIDCLRGDVRPYLEAVKQRAEERGRSDVADAILRGFRRSENRDRWRRARRFAAASVRHLLLGR